MLDHKFRERVSSSNYDFKRHTLRPCLMACVVLVFTGLVILFKPGPIGPNWAGLSFFLAFWMINYIFTVQKQEKLAAEAAEKDQKTAHD